MLYVTLNPELYNTIKDSEDLKLSIRNRFYIDSTNWKENGSVTNPNKRYINSFTLRLTVNTPISSYVILIVNMKDCERTQKLLPKILNQEEYKLIELTNELPMHTHSAIWGNEELYLGYGHDNIIKNRKLQDKESELIFGEYYQSSCLTLDLTGTPKLQFIQLKRPLFLIVYCQQKSSISRCREDMLLKGIDVRLYSEMSLVDNWLPLKNFKRMMLLE